MVKHGFTISGGLSAAELLSFVILSFSFFLLTLSVAMLIFYISELHSKLNVANSENMRLLDGMHEGVLIISKAKQRIMFANKPVRKLIECALDYYNLLSNSLNRVKGTQTSSEVLNARLFTPVKISIQEEVSVFQIANFTRSNVSALSLD